MSQSFHRQSNYFNNNDEDNNLLKYLQSLSPETIANLSQPKTSEVFQVMERNIGGLLGNLPAEGFGVMVSTSRENLGKLLASAMMSGYLLRNAEQRMDFEKALAGSNDAQNN
ncbi:DUF760 domain-containing protein [Cyanobacterium sp. IPPAS B-1200]|uniref:DUF760 domain-containing protein n=1 Tax=Cyanobacterium sp. IPPAS B-1200 TaxID=1562720 RepID=UPI000852539B|nr:DUF760 domain-containing protein [Cyanobacterium sp. IPPAS B-1200]OEJ78803.1 hypothetical protein A5482_02750 [Cyanobacterium sp. IPPAS B-1200]